MRADVNKTTAREVAMKRARKLGESVWVLQLGPDEGYTTATDAEFITYYASPDQVLEQEDICGVALPDGSYEGD